MNKGLWGCAKLGKMMVGLHFFYRKVTLWRLTNLDALATLYQISSVHFMCQADSGIFITIVRGSVNESERAGMRQYCLPYSMKFLREYYFADY